MYDNIDFMADSIGRLARRVASMLAALPARRQERGFTLFEVVVSMALVGTAVIAIVGVMATTSRANARSRENVTLLRLARAQVELIKNSPFQATSTNYALFTPIPEGFTVSFTSTDPGTTYTHPAATPTVITGSIQQITVTATGDFGSLNLTFYKNSTP